MTALSGVEAHDLHQSRSRMRVSIPHDATPDARSLPAGRRGASGRWRIAGAVGSDANAQGHAGRGLDALKDQF